MNRLPRLIVAVLLLLSIAKVLDGSLADTPDSVPQRESTQPAVAHPDRLADRFSGGADVLGRSFVVGGLGSSVGAGATLTDWQRDAPVAWFAKVLVEDAASGTLATWTTFNGSVAGSTIHDGLNRDWPELREAHPDVVVLAYGMNDGAPAQFDMGETYGGAMNDLAALIDAIRASGAVPVMLTSPSAHTLRTGWAPPGGRPIPQRPPVDTTEPVRRMTVPGVGVAPESTRHAAVNAGMRAVAEAHAVDVIDVEPFWLRAVAERGEDALFDATQFVHPNLLGHRLSYHAAIDATVPELLTARR